jgi:hypothetical protein
MTGGIGQKKHVPDDPEGELPIREPRIINPIPANMIAKAKIGKYDESRLSCSGCELGTERS